jgi:Lactate racemase N-terminal domain
VSRPVPRVPLLAGTRLVVVSAADDDVVLRPPPPGAGLADVGAAVRDALRFPLAGEPLARVAPRGGRATIVVEPPSLPLPGAEREPRHEAIEATVDELARAGVPVERQTILVAGGLARRLGKRELEHLVSPDFARRFHGRVEVHDAERPDLVDLGYAGATRLRVNPALLETDVVVTVTAAETVLHGGPGALVGAAGPEALRAAGADSLLERAGSQGWDISIALERALSARVPLIGASLVLHHPRFVGALHGYPYDPGALERIVRSPLRRVFGALPGALRMSVLRSLGAEIGAAGAFSGPPSVAHAEALLRAIEFRSAVLAGQLDAICIGVPRTTPYVPRERPNPIQAAYLGLGLALRLWRDAFPVVEGGTAILLHSFRRAYARPTQDPYRPFFQALGEGREPDNLVPHELAAAADDRALQAYRAGRSCHPLLPFADWAACRPALDRLGAVLIAGCRDATAARQLGFVPTHGIGAAMEMTRGWAERAPRIGFLLSPPYFPLQVQV